MTNYERVKAMDIKEMANWLANIRLSCEHGCDAQDLWFFNHHDTNCHMNCNRAIVEWLEIKVANNVGFKRKENTSRVPDDTDIAEAISYFKDYRGFDEIRHIGTLLDGIYEYLTTEKNEANMEAK